jgi:hypothetical protein
LEIVQRAGYALAALLDQMRVNHRVGNIRMAQEFGMDRVVVEPQDVADLIE